MWVGRMKMRRSLGLVVALLAGPVQGQTASADCAALVGWLEGVSGYQLSSMPIEDAEGACVLQAASLQRPDATKVTVEGLRLFGSAEDGMLTSVELDVKGLRVRPGLNDRDMAGWLRDLVRLQSAELSLRASAADGEGLTVEGARLSLSGGSELVLTARLPGAGLALPELVSGRVTALDLEWKNDGRVLRPLLEGAGARLEPGATGPRAIDAARAGLRRVKDALPAGLVPEESDKALEAVIDALPQGRGRLRLSFASDTGIGAAQLGVLALSDNPAGPDALARFFAGAKLTVDWQPGLLE